MQIRLSVYHRMNRDFGTHPLTVYMTYQGTVWELQGDAAEYVGKPDNVSFSAFWNPLVYDSEVDSTFS
jgi:hypothetical protein